MAAVRVLREIQISPSLPLQPPQPLTFLDIMWLQNSQMVERLFFYHFPQPISHFIDSKLPVFTESLSLTLRHYYLLAGSIRPSPDSVEQFEIVYTEGDSVNITLSEFTGDDFRNISGHHPRSLKNLRLLVPKPAKSSTSGGQFPPISIQITLFPNQGLCIGFAINHAVCDAAGSMRFIRSCAAACRSAAEPNLDDIYPPFLDRSIIIDTRGIRRKLFENMRQFKECCEEHLKKEDTMALSDLGYVSATFTLGEDQILRLKERVQAKAMEQGTKPPSFHMSAFVVTCAFVWKCLVKARGYDGVISQRFGSPVDWRSRMRPPIPSNYFGNCLGFFMAELNFGDMVGKNGMELAAIEIRKSIDWLQGRDIGEVLIVATDRSGEVKKSRPLSVAGSPKLRVYEVDFGWGRPVKVEITSTVETGAISLAESREEEGGLEVGLVLSEEEMSKFGTNFSSGLTE
ncbi:phenolic glucoside malonyltransferase 2-like [Phalaenopsis equestris]|uniref:phenolic glucoside malonyltransferase 2-like n=1 Tax=Phalaenopsis equestris TaxID=78828 RepID=UPI0009E28A9E|nr:phenolic glucoside malonyltransferase 2-like [Phalaenopsis equestris]